MSLVPLILAPWGRSKNLNLQYHILPYSSTTKAAIGGKQFHLNNIMYA